MFNVTSTLARERWRRILVNKMARLEPGMRVDLRKLFAKQTETAASLVEQGILNVDSTLDRDVALLGTILIKHYKRSAAVFTEEVYASLTKLKESSPKEAKGMRDEFWQFFNQWSRNQAASKATGLNTVTKKLIGRTISRSQQEGDSYGETAKKIREKVPRLSEMRARRISRTEVHTASVLSIDKSVETTRLRFEREWLTVKDERTRLSHYRADGQRRGQNEPFSVGGQQLMFPGDPRGSAGNVINCRCVLLYHRVRAMDKKPVPQAVTGETILGVSINHIDDAVSSSDALKALVGNTENAGKSAVMRVEGDIFGKLSTKMDEETLSKFKDVRRDLFRDWAGSNNSNGGAVIKETFEKLGSTKTHYFDRYIDNNKELRKGFLSKAKNAKQRLMKDYNITEAQLIDFMRLESRINSKALEVVYGEGKHVYRGMDSGFWTRRNLTVPTSDSGKMVLDSVSCWSLNKDTARDFGDYVFKVKIEADQVASSWLTNSHLLTHEREVLVTAKKPISFTMKKEGY